MIYIVTQFGSTASGLGALGINVSDFLIQLGTFIIAFLVLRQWAFKPILRVLRERRETIDKGVELGLQMQKEKDALETKVSSLLHKARTDADSIIGAANTEARAIARKAEEDARAKTEILLKEADERVKQTSQKAWQEIQKDVVALVTEATETILREKIDANKDTQLITEAIKDGRRA